MILPV